MLRAAGADDEALLHAFTAECAPYFQEIVRCWFANNLRALKPKPRGPSVDRAAAHIIAPAKARVVERTNPRSARIAGAA
jgi:hypothetical protein